MRHQRRATHQQVPLGELAGMVAAVRSSPSLSAERRELYEIARDLLTRSGYEHYEISNFALPGNRSRHNMVYWLNDEYIGLGASAVSYIGGIRSANLREPTGVGSQRI